MRVAYDFDWVPLLGLLVCNLVLLEGKVFRIAILIVLRGLAVTQFYK